MPDRETPEELAAQYERRFAPLQEYRRRIWSVLTSAFFQRYIDPAHTVLDLGCGWGEFINQIQAARKFGMDLNPDSARHLASGVQFLHHDCSQPWPVEPASLDTVFTSNFFEHLPGKDALRSTLAQALRCLKPGGRLICLGPNIRFLPAVYWDFWDHHLALSDRALVEGLSLAGFTVERCVPRFLPFSMSQGFAPPVPLVAAYLRLPMLWPVFGKQFLVVGRKPA